MNLSIMTTTTLQELRSAHARADLTPNERDAVVERVLFRLFGAYAHEIEVLKFRLSARLDHEN